MSDIKITGKLKLFSKKDYTSEIKKAIKSGTEAEINKMIRKVNKVFNELAPRYKERNGGYTRIIKLTERKGDDALQVRLELVD